MPAEEAVEAAATEATTAAVFAGGSIRETVVVEPSTHVVAADSGYDIARSRGVAVDVLVGDMDSISPEGLEEAKTLGVTIRRYAVNKDATDLELAIDVAIGLGATHVTIYAGEGGSLGHLLGIALGLTDERWADTHITWRTSGATVHRAIPSSSASLTTSIGAIITLLPIGDTAGVTTSGLAWPLTDATLLRGTTRGLSNTATQTEVSISVDSGAVLVVVEETDNQ